MKKTIINMHELLIKNIFKKLFPNFFINQVVMITKPTIDEYWYLSARFEINGNPFSIKPNITGNERLA